MSQVLLSVQPRPVTAVWNNRNNAATWARHSKQCVIHFNVLSPSHKESVHICLHIIFQALLCISDQLHQVMAHIEDLVEINGRVETAELTKAYHDPQVSASQNIDIWVLALNWIHLKLLRLNSFSSRLCNINIIEPKNWIYHYEPPAAKIDAIHF